MSTSCIQQAVAGLRSILTTQGQVDAAEPLLVGSRALAQKFGALSWRLRAAIDLVRLWGAQSRAPNARELLLPSFDQFSEGFGTRYLVVAAKLLASLHR